MPHAIVHIGLPKTGSTSLQVFLIENRDALAARGFAYLMPAMLPHSQVEIALIASSEAGQLARDRILRAQHGIETVDQQRAATLGFEQRMADLVASEPDDTFILSCEQLGAWLRKPALRASLDAWLRRHFDSVEYLAYVRPMDEFLVSVYSESVKRGSTANFATFLAKEGELPVPKMMIAWAQQFPGRVRFRRMPTRGSEDSIYRSFCAVLGTPLEGLRIPRPHNSSLCLRQINVMRRLNRVFGPPERRGPVRDRIALWARRGVQVLLKGGAPLRLSLALKQAIQDKYPRSVDMLIERLNSWETTATAAIGSAPEPVAG